MTDSQRSLLQVQYGYFVLQAKAARSADGLELTGILENLGTGEKRSFVGGDALGRLLESWGDRIGVNR